MKFASISKYLRVQKGVSWVTIHSRSQGLLGVFGLSGLGEDFREREKQKQKWRNRDGQR